MESFCQLSVMRRKHTLDTGSHMFVVLLFFDIHIQYCTVQCNVKVIVFLSSKSLALPIIAISIFINCSQVVSTVNSPLLHVIYSYDMGIWLQHTFLIMDSVEIYSSPEQPAV